MTQRQRERLETKFKNWGECPGQDELFDDEATLTPEIRAWRQDQQ